MKRLIISVAAICLLASLCLTSVAMPSTRKTERTPPGSFLRYRVHSVSELLRQVSGDTVVRMRYARHFRIGPDQVVAFLGNGLKLTSLRSPVRLSSHYVGPANRVDVKMKLLPKGTPIFARADGTPLLSGVCGNPLGPRKAAPPKQKAAAQMKPNPTAPVQTAEAPVETKVLAGPPEVVIAPPVAAEPGLVADTAPVMDQVAQLGLESAPVYAPDIMEAMAPAASSGFEGLGYLGGLAGLIAGLAPSSGGPPPSVPEPSGLMALGGCLAAAGALRRRRKAIS